MGLTDDGFARIVQPHLDAAFNLARWLMRDPAAAEDVVQDSMLRALRYLPSFRGGSARAWVLQIVRNTALDALKQRGVTVAGPADGCDIADTAPDPEESLARAEGVAQLDQALARLPPELRACLVMREMEDMSYKEIALACGVPVGTVMSRLWRARQMLSDATGMESP
jgi:RNA polymerase sigma-70 factor (ECF subfamily)